MYRSSYMILRIILIMVIELTGVQFGLKSYAWFQNRFYSTQFNCHTFLWSGSKDYVYLFTVTELSSCIASFETTGNLETCTFLRWLWICCCVVFVRLCFAELGITRILSRCWRNNAKIFVKMDTECWKRLVKKVFSLKELVIIIQKL